MSEEFESNLEQELIKRKAVVQESIVNLNDYFRIKITSDDHNLILEKKKKYDDGTDSWVNDGYFGYFDALLKDVANSMRKERLLQKKVNDVEDFYNAIVATDKEIKNWCKIKGDYDEDCKKE